MFSDATTAAALQNSIIHGQNSFFSSGKFPSLDYDNFVCAYRSGPVSVATSADDEQRHLTGTGPAVPVDDAGVVTTVAAVDEHAARHANEQ